MAALSLAIFPGVGLAAVTCREHDDRWVLRSDELQVEINRTSGRLTSLVSLAPTPFPIQDPDGQGLEVTVSGVGDQGSGIGDQGSGVSEWLGVAAGAPVLTQTERFGAKAYSITVDLNFRQQTTDHSQQTSDIGRPTSHPEAPVTGQLEYILSQECLEIRVRIEYLQDDPGRYVLRVCHPFRPADWVSQSYITWWIWETYPPDHPVRTLYQPRAGDVPGKIDDTVSYCYIPVGFLEGRDRYLLWGSLDLASSFVMGQQSALPFFSFTQVGLERGDSYTLDYFLKPFPKPAISKPQTSDIRHRASGIRYLYSWKAMGDWYVRHWHSSDPLTRDLIGPPHPPRDLPAGNLGAMSPEPQPEMEERMRAAHMTNVWFRVWGDILGARSVNLEHLKAQMRRKQELGFKLYLYFNANLYLPQAELDRPQERTGPPYKRWINRNPDGSLMIASQRLPEGQVSVIPDWCNEEFLQWYVDEVKRLVDFLQPDGIAWDAAWGIPWGAPSSYSCSSPKSALEQGLHRAQAEVYAWLREAHPDMRVIANGVLGLSPTNLVTDACLREFHAGWLSEAPTPELFKVFNMHTLNLIDLPWERQVGNYDRLADLPGLERIYARYMMLGLGFGTAVGTYGGSFVDHGPEDYDFRAPFIEKFSELYDFSGDIPATPLIGDETAFSIQPEWLRLTSTLWGNGERLLAAIYNGGEDETAHHRVNFQRLNDGDAAVTCNLPGLENIRRIDLLVYLTDWPGLQSLRRPRYLDGDLAVEINGSPYVYAPIGTDKAKYFGFAKIAMTDGYCTFENLPLSLFREGENSLRFRRYSGSGDIYLGLDEQGRVMAQLVPYRSILGDEPGTPVTLRLPRRTVEQYGPADASIEARVISRFGRPRVQARFEVRKLQDGAVEITGPLRRYELLLVRSARIP